MRKLNTICILGGGTAGWMTAAALSHKFKGLDVIVTLVESEAIGTVGVGEATLPHIRFFNEALGVSEIEFMKATNATFKLGIEFCDWGQTGQGYVHPFGDYGIPTDMGEFHQLWLRHSIGRGGKADARSARIDAYSYPILAAEEGRFQHPPSAGEQIGSNFGYAYQFDSGLYAKLLRSFSEARGVNRLEGKVVDVSQDAQTGDIAKLTLDNGQILTADLFVDCSGFRGVLIEQTLETGYDDWSKWLPCNSAFAVACEAQGPLLPFTRATARKAGWQWRIPLQNRVGNGHVFCSDFISDGDALDQLVSTLEGRPISEPKRLSFRTGKRRKLWHKNVVAIGLSGGFLEPLESTSIHLIQEGITHLISLFPDGQGRQDGQGGQIDQNDVDEYNTLMEENFTRVLDFLLLHYIANQREGEPFWDYFRTLDLPVTLDDRLEAWRARGHLTPETFGIFLPPSWIAVLLGQNIAPSGYDPRFNMFTDTEVAQNLENIQALTSKAVANTPQHEVYLKSFLAGR